MIDSNPASKVGKFNKRERGENKAQAMTENEAHAFLNACVEVCPEHYPLFFTALIPGENVAWIDTLDSTPEKVTATDANRTQTRGREVGEGFSGAAQDAEAEEVIWLPPRDSNPDMLIQSQLSCR